MERRKQGIGWETFFEHWGFSLSVVIIAAIATIMTRILMFFIH